MFERLFQKTPIMQQDNRITNTIYWIFCAGIAAAMALAASGSGNPVTIDPLPNWVNTGSNILCVLIGILVLLPKTRPWGALAAAVMMGISMITNYTVDGPAYFLKVLPFNAVTLALSVLVFWHHRKDL